MTDAKLTKSKGTNNMYVRQCERLGPRGGICRNLQVTTPHPLDFCRKHQQLELDGYPQFCRRCNEIVDRKERENG